MRRLSLAASIVLLCTIFRISGAIFPLFKFDARQAWPECSTWIASCPDQGPNGWCWMMTTVLTVGARMCIQGLSEDTHHFPSFNATTECDIYCGNYVLGSAICLLVDWVDDGIPYLTDTGCVHDIKLSHVDIIHNDPIAIAHAIAAQGPCISKAYEQCDASTLLCTPFDPVYGMAHFVRIFGWTSADTWLVANTWGEERGIYEAPFGMGRIEETVYCPVVPNE